MARSNNATASNFGTSINARPAAALEPSWVGAGCKDWRQEGRGAVDIATALKEAGLDFTVEKQPLVRIDSVAMEGVQAGYDTIPVNKQHIVPSHMATVRTDTDDMLGVVGKDYGIVQNTKAFEFIDFIKDCAGEAPLIETAGVLNGGSRIFVTAQLGNQCFDLGPNDPVKTYVVFTNTHDGSGSVMAFITPQRVVCQNTLAMAVKGAGKNKLKFNHTSGVHKRLDWELEENRRRAMEVFGNTVKFTASFREAMLHLRDQNVSGEYVKEFAASIYLNPTQMDLFKLNNFSVDGVEEIGTQLRNKVNGLQDAIENGIGQEYYRGSKLWLINGLTTFFHNELKHSSPEAEFTSTFNGDIAKKVQTAYDRLVKIPA